MPRSDFDFQDVFETLWGSEATDGAGEVVTCQTRAAGEQEGQDGTDVELWSQGCIVYRPKKPDGDGKCQLLTVQMGGKVVGIASRDSRADKASGAMNEGDAAFCSPTGKVAYRANDDGSMSMLKQGEDADAYISIQKDGTLCLGNQWGQIELGPKGFQVFINETGEAMALGGGFFNVIASNGALQCGGLSLGVGAAVPLTFAPASGVGKPAPNILI